MQATPRRVWVLIGRLPLGSWVKDQGPGSWTNESYLLASVVDAVNQNSWLLAAVNSKKKPKRPEAFPRPGTKAKKKTSWTDIGKQLGAL